MMNRRTFLAGAAAAAVGAGPASRPVVGPAAAPLPVTNALPRWRGFNLLNLFEGTRPRAFDEATFATVAGWGFDFVRVPMSYWAWSSPADQTSVREAGLAPVDQAVKFGRAHGVHVNLNLHRLPGYCVNSPKEPNDLWKDAAAVDAAAGQWAMLASRYKGVPGAALSFNLINEPREIAAEAYVRVIDRLTGAVRAVDPGRPILVDGLDFATVSVPRLGPPAVVGQSSHGYDPIRVSHFRASWIKGSDGWPEPTWPLVVKPGDVWDKARLKRTRIDPWVAMQARTGVGVHVGEFGAYNRTPHEVALRWMVDCLDLWKTAGWGWALWNLYGEFGVMDSGRADVTYERFQGHSLDRAMLEVLRAG